MGLHSLLHAHRHKYNGKKKLDLHAYYYKRQVSPNKYGKKHQHVTVHLERESIIRPQADIMKATKKRIMFRQPCTIKQATITSISHNTAHVHTTH